MKAFTKQIKFAAIISYAAIFINIIITLLYTPWMVSKIGKSNYALYTLANTLISVFLMDFGIGSVVSRFISKYRAEGQEEKANQLLGLVAKIFFIYRFADFNCTCGNFFLFAGYLQRSD